MGLIILILVINFMILKGIFILLKILFISYEMMKLVAGFITIYNGLCLMASISIVEFLGF